MKSLRHSINERLLDHFVAGSTIEIVKNPSFAHEIDTYSGTTTKELEDALNVALKYTNDFGGLVTKAKLSSDGYPKWILYHDIYHVADLICEFENKKPYYYVQTTRWIGSRKNYYLYFIINKKVENKEKLIEDIKYTIKIKDENY